MAQKRRISTTTALIYLLSLHNIRAFTFSAPNNNDNPDAYELAEAVRALEMDDNSYARRGYGDPSRSYVNEEYTGDNERDFDDDEYLNRVMDEYRKGSAGYNIPRAEQDLRGRISEKFNNKNRENQAATSKELETIFSDDDNEEAMSNVPDMPLQIPLEPPHIDADMHPPIPQSQYLDMSGLDAEQIRRIMDEVERMKTQAEKEIETPEPEEGQEPTEQGENDSPVSDEELNNMFDDDEEETANEQGTMNNDVTKEVEEVFAEPQNDVKTDISYNRLFNNQKNKRSITNQETDSGDTVKVDLDKLFNILAKLRLKERLESREINVLSDSLNGATSAQVQRSISGLQGELTSIERAIAIEKALEKVDSQMSDQDKTYLDILADAYLQEQMNQLSYPEAASKRDPSQNSMSNIPQNFGGRDDENDIQRENDMNEAMANYAAEKVINEIRNERLQPPQRQDLLENNSEDEFSDESPDGEQYGDIKKNEREAKMENIRRLLSSLESTGKTEQADMCPEIETITDDCAIADEVDIGVDNEARDLCSRHQACYSCGWTLKRTSHQCDDAYIVESEQLCEDNAQCLTRALAFLGFIKSEHRVGNRLYNACLSSCVVDYIYGVDEN